MAKKYKIEKFGDEYVVKEGYNAPLIGWIIQKFRENPQMAGFFIIVYFLALLYLQKIGLLTYSGFIIALGIVLVLGFHAMTDNIWVSLTTFVFFLATGLMFFINPVVDQYATLALSNVNPFINNMYSTIPYGSSNTIQATLNSFDDDFATIAVIFLVDAFLAIIAYVNRPYAPIAKLAIMLFTLAYPFGWFAYIMVTPVESITLPAWINVVMEMMLKYTYGFGKIWTAFTVTGIYLAFTGGIGLFINFITNGFWGAELDIMAPFKRK